MGVAIGDFDNDGRDDIYITALEGDRLFHNEGGGKFRDVTAGSGIRNANFGTSAAWLDYDRDGKLDLFVANYVQWTAKGGLWCSLRGAMGADSGDYDRSGRPHLLVGNFSNQMLGLYHNEGTGLFVDEAPSSTVGRASLLTLAFGVFFFDYDLDGYPDIFAGNGHIEEEIGRVQPKVQYKEAPLLFDNLGKRRFENG